MEQISSSFKFSLIALLYCFTGFVVGQPIERFFYNHPVVVCEFDQPQSQVPAFTEQNCNTETLLELNPQHKELWVSLEFTVTEAIKALDKPRALYLFGKASSEFYLNGTLLGKNGQPAFDTLEIEGKLDSVFYIPDDLLTEGNNRLVMRLSAQHSLIELNYPIHVLGVGTYADPKQFVQTGSSIGLLLVGAFFVGTLYFLVLSVGKGADNHARLFSTLCFLAALQLSAEISRGLVDYTYSWLDVRLLTVTACSCMFGMLLLIYSSRTIAANHATHWIYAGAIFTTIAVIFAEGFDSKTTAGIFIPLLVSLTQLFYVWQKTKDVSLLPWFGVQLAVTTTIIITSASFHEIIYFMVIGSLLCYLFVRQARLQRKQHRQLQEEQKHIAKLEYRLTEQAQHHSPTKIEVNIAGSAQFITTSDIAYCKAAGDYVELHMTDKTERLYSGSLKLLEDLLPPTFVKVHRSYLVNLHEVSSLAGSGQANSHSLCLSNEQEVPVSRRMLPSVRETLRSSLVK